MAVLMRFLHSAEPDEEKMENQLAKLAGQRVYVEQDGAVFYTVDSAAENADVVFIAETRPAHDWDTTGARKARVEFMDACELAGVDPYFQPHFTDL